MDVPCAPMPMPASARAPYLQLTNFFIDIPGTSHIDIFTPYTGSYTGWYYSIYCKYCGNIFNLDSLGPLLGFLSNLHK